MDHITKKYYRAGATYLSPEAIEDIRQARGSIPNASKVMAKKYKIGPQRVYDIWRSRELNQPIRIQRIPLCSSKPTHDNIAQDVDWDKEIESIYDLYFNFPDK